MSELPDKFARQAWSRAEVHLLEAEAQDAEVSPHLMVHGAYYAMFHAARAVLLKTLGTAPKKHASVLRQFGLAVRDRDDRLRHLGEDLKTVQALRFRADYSETDFVSPGRAKNSLKKARSFLSLCGREFGFHPEGKATDV